MALSPRLRLVMLKQKRTLGYVWLAMIPFLLFLLCQRYQTQLMPHQPTTSSFSSSSSPSALDFLMSRLYPTAAVTNDSFTVYTYTHQALSATRLYELERRVTKDYIRVRLALAASSGRLHTAGKESPLPLTGVEALKGLDTFQPLLTPREKAGLLRVVEVFTHACRVHSLEFFLLGDSLLGAVRHHGLVPWRDVSVTVGMSKEEQGRVREALEGVEGVTLMWPDPDSWSLRLWDTPPHPPSFSRMTYLLIRFYQKNSSHVWVDGWNSRRLFTADVDRVFPLALRPFEGQMMPVPCDVMSVLDARDLQRCRTVIEDVEEATFREAGALPCDVLTPVFPFVTRRWAMTSQSTVEQVTVNDTLLSTALADGTCHDSSLFFRTGWR